tara:strand:+ start:200 stop:301 length:102 start_codon:yes stop_codon:yes gene_type:complete
VNTPEPQKKQMHRWRNEQQMDFVLMTNAAAVSV